MIDLRSLAATIRAIRAEPAAAAVVVPVARDAALPLPRRGETALIRARALAAGGHLRDALVTLDAVRPTDAQQPDAERLRADIQRQLLALIPSPESASTEREKVERRDP